MAVNAYAGKPGSGKTYTVVKHVILEHLKVGRRIVTNVEGLKLGTIRQYLISQGLPPDKIGEILVVPDTSIGLPEFFPTEYKPADLATAQDAIDHDDGVVITSTSSVVQPGDLVIIDEAWRW